MSLSETLFSVLMVGHSLFGTTGPTMLDRLLTAGGADAEVVAQIINGAPLRYNWEHAASAQGVNAREVLPQGEVTHLILTEAVPLDNHVKWSETGASAGAFARLAEAANPHVQIYVQETWHSLKSGTGQAVEYDGKAHIPWRIRLDQDLPVWEGVVTEIADHLTTQTATVSLIPAGQAMALLYDEIAADRVPGVTSIEAFFDDDIHLSDRGHAFVAMVQYATLTGRSPEGLPTRFRDRYGSAYEAPGADLASVLQRIAWQAVERHGGAVTSASIAPPPQKVATPAASLETLTLLTPARPDGVPPGTNSVAIGLASVADWSPQVPFLDLMKTARPWIGHLPGRWSGMEHDALKSAAAFDAHGWPTRMPSTLGSIGTLVLTDMPPDAVSLGGRYVLRYEGQGIIEVGGRATKVHYAPGEIQFDYTPGPGSVDIRIQRMSPNDPPRNITIVQAAHLDAYAAGAVFHPQWLAHLAPFSAVRFMDWMQTNNSTQTSWDARPKPQDASFAGGVPLEVMVDLANRLQADAWLNVPHLADDAYVRQMADLVRNRLDPGLKVYVEFSNEVWNWQFDQARWADAQARARWGQADRWVQFYGLRAAEVARIWSEVFTGAERDRLVAVIATQSAWLGLEQDILEAPLAVAEGAPAPKTAFDAYAVSGYFGGVLGLEDRGEMLATWLRDSRAQAQQSAAQQGLQGAAAVTYVAAHRYDHATAMAARELLDGGVSGRQEDTLLDLATRVWPYHAQVAQAAGLDLIMYEGGSHVVGIGARRDLGTLTEFFQHLNYTPEMGRLYTVLLESWHAVGGQLFNVFSDVYPPSKWGSWGGLRHLDDANPRWQAVMAFQ